ncbi:aldolase/citrate lyase family protein [Paraburkholderia sp. PREW-6R]|uniref:HpcH/HpaI aldolase family protein n=1 Tax=Paraburkholderia sp. PREW-6R TaxID=3141544 RepID=UPI0031F4BDFE
MSVRSARIKQMLHSGQPAYGLLHGFASPQVAEMAALAGYDIVIVDAEHGPGDTLSHQAIMQAINAGGAAAMLRVASNDAVLIGKALDAGADMLLVPGVNSADEARAVARAALYPPAGKRGNGTLVARASGYGLMAQGYDSRYNNDAFVSVMIESRQGASNARAIAAVEGIDAVVVGVFDLSADMGVTAQFDHPDFIAAMRDLEKAVAAEGKALGTVLYPGTTLADLLERGHRLITLSADTLLLGRAMREQLASARLTEH